MTEKTATGQVTKDGKLALYLDEVKAEAARHKGERLVVRFTFLSSEPSRALLGYYWRYVVPEMRRALYERGERLTERQTERQLRKWSPVMINDADELMSVSDVDSRTLCEHIEHIKQFAAEEFGIYIDDPTNFIKQ